MKTFLLFLAVIRLGATLPLNDVDQTKKEDTMMDDMIITAHQRRIIFRKPTLKNGLRNPSEIWPNATVYYTFNSSICKFL